MSPLQTVDPQAESRLPIVTILTALQDNMQRYPDLEKMSDQEWAELENCMNKPVAARRLQRYRPAVIRPSDRKFKLSFFRPTIDPNTRQILLDEDGDPVMEEYQRKFMVRKMDAGDVMDLASVGPQLLETFFGGDVELAARMPVQFLAGHILAQSIGERFKMCMHELSEWVMVKLCDLMIDTTSKEPLEYEEFLGADPMESEEAITKTLSVNQVFFSTLTQRLPENLREALRFLTGMLSAIGNPFVEKIIMQGSKSES